MSDIGTVRVQLLDLPVDLHGKSSEHQEALRRELAFVEHARAPEAAPARLQALTEELTERYGGLTMAQTARLEAALAAGEETIDLEYDLPPDVADATIQLGALLDELDEFCREGELLTLVTPPDVLSYREWVLREFVRQIRDGREPEPWRGLAPVADDPPQASAGDDVAPVVIRVDDDLDLASVSALRQVLVDHIEQGATNVTLDLSSCEFLDSTGLSLLVATHHRLRDAGGGPAIAGATGGVRGVLDMAGTTEFFDQG